MKNIYKKHNSFSNFKTKKETIVDYNEISKCLAGQLNIETNIERKKIFKDLINVEPSASRMRP